MRWARPGNSRSAACSFDEVFGFLAEREDRGGGVLGVVRAAQRAMPARSAIVFGMAGAVADQRRAVARDALDDRVARDRDRRDVVAEGLQVRGDRQQLSGSSTETIARAAPATSRALIAA